MTGSISSWQRPGIALTTVLIALVCGLGAQTRPESQAPSATFQVEVDYVDVDVVVTDERGNFVRRLAREDFELLEDGKPVTIDTFATVEIPVERHDERTFGGRTVADDVRSNQSLLAGRFYVIVLDDIGTSALRSQHVINAARQFVQQHFAANDTAAVVFTSGRRERAQDFTSDRNLLLSAIDKFAGTKLRSSTLDKLDGYYQQKALEEGLAAQTGEPVDANSAAGRAANPLNRGEGYANRSYDVNDMERGQRALGVLGQIRNYAEFLTNVRGRRKALVLFSEGIDYPVNDIFGAHDAGTVLGAMQDVIAAAARGNVNIFTVDPRGLVGLTSEYIELNKPDADLFNIGARDPRYGMQPHTALMAEMRLTQDSLRTLSEETGGLASIDTNTFSTAFSRIVQANSVYYMLGYDPPNHPRDGKFHRIDVRVKRPGVRVTSRKGYAAPRTRPSDVRQRAERERVARTKGGDVTSSELREMLDKPLPQGGVTIAVQAAPFKGSGRNASIALAIELDASGLQFVPQKEKNVLANTVELSLFSINERGTPLQGLRTELQLNLRPDTYERVKLHGLRVNPRVELPPGRYQVRVGVRETVRGEMGTVFYDLDVPDFAREPLSMSGLLLSTASADRALTVQSDPAVAKFLPGAAASRRSFLASDVLSLYSEIYDNGAATGPSRQIDVVTRLIDPAGREVSNAREALASTAAQARERPATYVVSKQVPLKGLTPGRYLVRVEAQLRGNGGTVARESPISVRAE